MEIFYYWLIFCAVVVAVFVFLMRWRDDVIADQCEVMKLKNIEEREKVYNDFRIRCQDKLDELYEAHINKVKLANDKLAEVFEVAGIDKKPEPISPYKKPELTSDELSIFMDSDKMPPTISSFDRDWVTDVVNDHTNDCLETVKRINANTATEKCANCKYYFDKRNFYKQEPRNNFDLVYSLPKYQGLCVLNCDGVGKDGHLDNAPEVFADQLCPFFEFRKS